MDIDITIVDKKVFIETDVHAGTTMTNASNCVLKEKKSILFLLFVTACVI